MREIKFRAFLIAGKNNEIKAMIEDVSFSADSNHTCGTGLDWFNEQVESQTGFKPNDTLDCYSKDGVNIDLAEFDCYDTGEDYIFFKGEFMQFTGFLDKTGKEIYEGDRMTHPNIGDEIVLEVISEHGGWHLSGWPFTRMDVSEGLVIGNIYQNPELLKEKELPQNR